MQQARLGLATRACLVRTVWAPGNTFYATARALELVHHLFVDRLHAVVRHHSAIHDRLIGDHKHPNAGLREAGHGFLSAGEEMEFLPAFDVVRAVLVDDAVAIQADGLYQRLLPERGS